MFLNVFKPCPDMQLVACLGELYCLGNKLLKVQHCATCRQVRLFVAQTGNLLRGQVVHSVQTCNLLPATSCMSGRDFARSQQYRQVLLRARISYGNSVRLSVRPSVTTRYTFNARWDRDSGSSPCDSLESLVSYEVILWHWVKRFPSNEGIKEGYPLRSRYFNTIGSPSVKTVADRHSLVAYHNKHCWRAFQWYQHRWPWTTLNPKNRGF